MVDVIKIIDSHLPKKSMMQIVNGLALTLNTLLALTLNTLCCILINACSFSHAFGDSTELSIRKKVLIRKFIDLRTYTHFE